jgi:hypothetical protein
MGENAGFPRKRIAMGMALIIPRKQLSSNFMEIHSGFIYYLPGRKNHMPKVNGFCIPIRRGGGGRFVTTAMWLIFTTGCSLMLLDDNGDFDITFTPTTKLLVIVEDGLDVQAELDQYKADLEAEKISVLTLGWQTGTAEDLRGILKNYHDSDKIDGAFLIGNLPAAWYEMSHDGRYETFPCDLFLMDPMSSWRDSDGNGLYDDHSPLALKLYVSRVMGSLTELKKYFYKTHLYRTGGMQMPRSAYLFKDDDWYVFQQGSRFGLTRIYDTVELCESPEATTKSAYLDKLQSRSAEFINQWIHSSPGTLCVLENGFYNTIDTQDVKTYNFEGLFYDLYDCSAARFTENNLGMSYLMSTDYALAIFGSTKIGGSYRSLAFYDVLAKKGTWGDAYRNWYNYFGKSSDKWFLGMVILGDPALRVSARGPVYRFIDPSLPAEPDAVQLDKLWNTLLDFQQANE